MERIILGGEVFEGMEDLAYNNDAKQEYIDPDERSQAYAEYQEARFIQLLSGNDGYKMLLRWANREVETATRARLSFKCKSSKDKEREERINRALEDAVTIHNWLQQTVENAESIPKPV